MYAKRRDDILAMLKETSPRSVKEIAESLLVSEMTVRRDLTQMEREGLVKRSFGTASLTAKDGKPEFLQAGSEGGLLAPGGKRGVPRPPGGLGADGGILSLDGGAKGEGVAKAGAKKGGDL